MLIAKAPLQREMRFRSGAFVIAFGLTHMGCDIVAEIGVNACRSFFERLFEIDHRGQNLQVYRDVVERILGDIAAFRHHDRDRLAGTTDGVFCQRHMGACVEDAARNRRRRHQQRAGLPIWSEIFGGIDRNHAGTFQRLGDID